MSASLIHQGPAYELSVSIDSTPYGHHVRFLSHVPTARRPEQQVRFQTTLSDGELAALRDAIDNAIASNRDAVQPAAAREGQVAAVGLRSLLA